MDTPPGTASTQVSKMFNFSHSKPDVRKFDTGAIRDSDNTKEDYVETISWTALRRHAQYMTGKKSRYGAGNFKKGIPIESYEQSLVRHMQKYFENKYEQGTVETKEDHLAAMFFNICGIMHEEERIRKNGQNGKQDISNGTGNGSKVV